MIHNQVGAYTRNVGYHSLNTEISFVNETSQEFVSDAKKRTTDKQFDVIVKLRVDSKSKNTDNVLFVLELDYGGVFQIENIPDDQLHPYLLIECPRMLFPFLRRIVSDITRDGGFPPLNLENIDFLKLYRQEIERRKQENKKATPSLKH